MKKLLFLYLFFSLSTAFAAQLEIHKKLIQSSVCDFYTNEIVKLDKKSRKKTIVWSGVQDLISFTSYSGAMPYLIFDPIESKNKNKVVCFPIPDFTEVGEYSFGKNVKYIGGKYPPKGYYLVSKNNASIFFLDPLTKKLFGGISYRFSTLLAVAVTNEMEIVSLTKRHDQMNFNCLQKWDLVNGAQVWKHCFSSGQEVGHKIKMKDGSIYLEYFINNKLFQKIFSLNEGKALG